MQNVTRLNTSARKRPNIKSGKVNPRRDYLTPKEVERLLDAAGQIGRHGHRDRTLLLIAYRHGLRASELVALRWDQIDLAQGLLRVQRLKNGVPLRRTWYAGPSYALCDGLGGSMKGHTSS